MSNKIQALAWAAPLPTSEKFVLVALADNANDEGVCYPRIATICDKTSLSERTVQKALKWLECAKCIAIERRSGRGNLFHIHPERYEAPPQNLRGMEEGTPAADAPPQSVHPVPAAGTPAADAPPPPQQLRGPPQLPHPESSLNLLRESSPNPQDARAGEASDRTADDPNDQEALDRLQATYPANTHPESDWLIGRREASRRVEEGHTWAVLQAGVDRLRVQKQAQGKIGTEHIYSPKNFFTAERKLFLETFPLPVSAADRRERTALEQLVARREAIGIPGFREPQPGESADQYRLAQDAEWNRVKSAPPAPAVRELVAGLCKR